MKRIKMLVACVMVTGASLAALATVPVAAQAATVELRETMRGPIMTNEAGFTLYIFTADKKHTGPLRLDQRHHTATAPRSGRRSRSPKAKCRPRERA